MKDVLLLLFFWLIVIMPGCQCSDVNELTDQSAGKTTQADTLTSGIRPTGPGIPDPIPATITASGAMELSEKMRANLIEHFDLHLQAQNEGDFDTHVSYFYQPMLDSLNEDSLATYMKNFHEMGCRNVHKGYEIDKISPIVETDSTYVVMLRVNAKLDVVFDPHFEKAGRGTPADWGGMIRDQYPTAQFDEANRTYHIEEKLKYYCLTSKDTLDFKFLMHAYYTDKRLAKLLDYDTFYQLRVYEK